MEKVFFIVDDLFGRVVDANEAEAYRNCKKSFFLDGSKAKSVVEVSYEEYRKRFFYEDENYTTIKPFTATDEECEGIIFEFEHEEEEF